MVRPRIEGSSKFGRSPRAPSTFPKPGRVRSRLHQKRRAALQQNRRREAPPSQDCAGALGYGCPGGALEGETRQEGVRLIEIAEAFQIPVRVELRLPAVLAAVRGRIAVVGARIQRLAEPVRGVQAEALPTRNDQRDAGRIVPGVGTIQHQLHLGQLRIGPAVVDGGYGWLNAWNHAGAIDIPHLDNLRRPAADVAELKAPAAPRQGLPARVVLVRVGGHQVRIQNVQRNTLRALRAAEIGAHRIQQIWVVDDQLHVSRRVESQLLVGSLNNVVVGQGVGSAQHAEAAGHPPGSAGHRPKVIAVAVVGERSEAIGLGGNGDRLVAEAEAHGQRRSGQEFVSHVEGLIPIPEPPVGVAHGDEDLRRQPHAHIGNAVSDLVVGKRNGPELGVVLNSVEVTAKQVVSGGQLVPATNVADLRRLAEHVFGAVDGQILVGADCGESVGREQPSHVVVFGDELRGEAVEAERDVERRRSARLPHPGDAGLMRARGSVRVLTLHQLKRQHALVHQLVSQNQPVARIQGLVDAGARRVAVDLLRGVGVEHPLVDVGPVRLLGRIRGEDSLDVRGEGGIGRQRRAFRRKRNQDVSVHHPARLLLARGEREDGALPDRRQEVHAVVVLPRGLHAAHLEERPGAEDAVQVRFEQAPVNAGPGAGRDVQGR